MVGFGAKKRNAHDITLDTPVPEFIPYACHYSPNTILTKNGELLQIIKITGFSSESVGKERIDLRDIIRKAISESLPDQKFALWFNTIRRKKSLEPKGTFEPESFPESLNTSWSDRHDWKNTYINELYITIIYAGETGKFFKKSDFFRSLSRSMLTNHHTKMLTNAEKALNTAVDSMLSILKDFGAIRLKMVKSAKGIYYSELLQFFGKIVNLAEAPIKAPLEDISTYLATHKIAFGFNTLEIIGKTGKHFAAVFTIKDYQDLKSNVLDTFLQLDLQFVITQTADFIPKNEALESYQNQKYILDVSRDKNFRKLSGIDDLFESDQGKPTDYCESQLTILLLSGHKDTLEENIEKASKALNKLGMVATRRDLRLEECFWAQLPANFTFLSRKKPMNTKRIGGFASLYNFPAGQKSGNLWGPPVSICHTANGTPYFFNFHVGDKGHTAILGPYGSGKTVLMNFLVSEAQRYQGKLFFFDQDRASKVFINALGGYYTIIEPNTPSENYAFNPLLIPDSQENRAFLRRWLMFLAIADGNPINEQEKQAIINAVEQLYTLPEEQRRLSAIAPLFGDASASGSLGARMSIWHGQGKYAHLFDNERKSIVPFDKNIYGFGMSHVIKDNTTLGPVLLYLLHRVEMALDGTPTIVVLDEAWNLVNNPLFAPGLEAWLDRMSAKNAIVIFATESVKNASTSEITTAITQKITTQIFLPNKEANKSSKAYMNTWGLNEHEFEMLAAMETLRKEFMLRQGGNTIVANLDLSNMEELHVLSGNDETATIMEEAKAEAGNEPKDWLPLFYLKMAEK